MVCKPAYCALHALAVTLIVESAAAAARCKAIPSMRRHLRFRGAVIPAQYSLLDLVVHDPFLITKCRCCMGSVGTVGLCVTAAGAAGASNCRSSSTWNVAAFGVQKRLKSRRQQQQSNSRKWASPRRQHSSLCKGCVQAAAEVTTAAAAALLVAGSSPVDQHVVLGDKGCRCIMCLGDALFYHI